MNNPNPCPLQGKCEQCKDCNLCDKVEEIELKKELEELKYETPEHKE